jgi:hypothetical protein
MFPRITSARYIRDFTILIRFHDGVGGEVDLKRQLYGEIFEPLKDLSYFRQFRLDPELHTIVWPNGADFAPEFLYHHAQITG